MTRNNDYLKNVEDWYKRLQLGDQLGLVDLGIIEDLIEYVRYFREENNEGHVEGQKK